METLNKRLIYLGTLNTNHFTQKWPHKLNLICSFTIPPPPTLNLRISQEKGQFLVSDPVFLVKCLRSLPAHTAAVKTLFSKTFNSNTSSKRKTQNHSWRLERPIFPPLYSLAVQDCIQPGLCKHMFQELHKRHQHWVPQWVYICLVKCTLLRHWLSFWWKSPDQALTQSKW